MFDCFVLEIKTHLSVLMGLTIHDKMNQHHFFLRSRPTILFILCSLLFVSCRSGINYSEILIPQRKLNLLGLEMISTKYLNENPGDFFKFSRILTRADDALQEYDAPTKRGVMKWIKNALKKEGLDEKNPVHLFLKTVYLKDWGKTLFDRIDEGEREYLYDLMGAAMGGMHRCATCSTH